jgi:hypothetical protein
MPTEVVNEVVRGYNANNSRKERINELYENCYRYAVPHRHLLRDDTANAMEGPVDDVIIYDSTAMDSTIKFSNTMVKNVTPPQTRWQQFVHGTEIEPALRPRVNALLDVVTRQYFNLLGRTNFDIEMPEVYNDLAVGTGALLIQDYDDDVPATFTAAPATQLVVGEGPSGIVDRIWRKWNVKAIDIPKKWPKFRTTDRITSAMEIPNSEVEILESTIHNYKTGKDEYRVISFMEMEEIFNDTFDVSPWVVGRYSKVSGEVYGRGPLINALPDIKTLNKVVEFVLQNSALAISGVYTAADDGVINPETVEIAPGVVIPVGFNGGVNGRSLDALPRSGEFDVSQLILNDMRTSVRRKLLDFGSDTLETVRSAEEIRDRRSLLLDSMGASFGRINFELIGGINKRLLSMWGKSGDLPKLSVDGKTVTTQHLTPLANVQDDQDLDSLSSAAVRMNGIIPGLAALSIKPEKAAVYIGEKSGLPQEVMSTEDEILENQKGVGELAAGGMDVASIAKAAGG